MPNGPKDFATGAPNVESYTVNGDGTVTDNVTRLIWQQTAPATTYTWAGAAAYCTVLTLAGHSDWRVPSLVELVSIVDYGLSNPCINATTFPSTAASNFWSATSEAGGATAWSVSFYGGNTTSILGVSSAWNVRCVR